MRKQAGSDRQRNYRSVRGDLEEQAERSKQPDPAEKLRSRLRERGRDDEGEAYRAGPSSELGSSGKHAIGRKPPVRTSIVNWRALQDSNLRPQD